MLRLVITPKTVSVALLAATQFTAKMVDEEFIDKPVLSRIQDPNDPMYQPLPEDEHAEWQEQNPGKARLDTLPVAGEQKRVSVANNPSFSGIYKYPKEEVEWLNKHPGKTHVQYEAFINAPPLPAPKVKWSASAGSIDENGLFTAPDSDATATVTAASVDDADNFDTAVVTVGKGAGVQDRDTFGNKFGSKKQREVFATVVPLTEVQMDALTAANVPAASNTAPLTQAQLAALGAAGVPAKTV